MADQKFGANAEMSGGRRANAPVSRVGSDLAGAPDISCAGEGEPAEPPTPEPRPALYCVTLNELFLFIPGQGGPSVTGFDICK